MSSSFKNKSILFPSPSNKVSFVPSLLLLLLLLGRTHTMAFSSTNKMSSLIFRTFSTFPANISRPVPSIMESYCTRTSQQGGGLFEFILLIVLGTTSITFPWSVFLTLGKGPRIRITSYSTQDRLGPKDTKTSSNLANGTLCNPVPIYDKHSSEPTHANLYCLAAELCRKNDLTPPETVDGEPNDGGLDVVPCINNCSI